MTLKNQINPDHAADNKYELEVVTLPKITFIEVSGFEEETEMVDMPDRTKQSGGQSKPFEFTAKVPLHHTAEIAACDIWYEQGKDPVSPDYEKVGTMNYKTIGDNVAKTYTLLGMKCSKRKTPDVAMSNEGEVAANEYTFWVDEMLPA